MKRSHLTLLLYAVGLVFVSYLFINSWNDIKNQLGNINILYVCGSTLLTLIQTLTGCWLLCQLLNKYGISIGLKKTCRIFYLSQLAKYLPGVIWGFTLQASLVNKPGVLGRVFLANLEFLLYMTGSFTLLCVALLLFQHSIMAALFAIFLAGLFIHVMNHYSLQALMPRWMKKLLIPASQSESQSNAEPSVIAAKLQNVPVALACLVSLVTYLLSLMTNIWAFYNVTPQQALLMSIYQCLAWVAGIFTFVVPAGMGVREAVFIALGSLTTDMSPELIQSVAILNRFIQMLQDVIFCLGAFLLIRFSILAEK